MLSGYCSPFPPLFWHTRGAVCGFVYCNLKALVSLGHTLVLHASCSLLPLVVAREYDACNVVQPEREPRRDLSLSEILGVLRPERGPRHGHQPE